MAEVKKQTVNYIVAAQEMSNGLIVKGYTDHPGVDHPVVKLYEKGTLQAPEEDLAQIPDRLYQIILNAGISDDVTDFTFDIAQKKGKLIPVQPAIEFYVQVRDEKTTKRVAWEETLALWAASPAGSASIAGVAGGEPMAYAGLTDGNKALITLVGNEVEAIANEALNIVDRVLQHREAAYVSHDQIFDRVFGQIAWTFKDIRGAVVLPVSQLMAVNLDPILDGDIETFAEDLAAGHEGIVNAEAARKMIRQLGILVNKENVQSAEYRAEIASKLWLYADLLIKYQKSPDEAKRMVMGTTEDIPW